MRLVMAEACTLLLALSLLGPTATTRAADREFVFGDLTVAQMQGEGGGLYCDHGGATLDVVVKNGKPNAVYHAIGTGIMSPPVEFRTDANGYGKTTFSSVEPSVNTSPRENWWGGTVVVMVWNDWQTVAVNVEVTCPSDQGG